MLYGREERGGKGEREREREKKRKKRERMNTTFEFFSLIHVNYDI